MKRTTLLMTKISTAALLAFAFSGCGFEDVMQKQKVQDNLSEASRQLSLGNLTSARAWTDRAIHADPGYAGAYVTVPDTSSMTGNDDMVEGSATIYGVYVAGGDYADAVSYLKQGAKEFPNEYRILTALLDCEQIVGDSAGEQQTANQLVSVLNARIAKGNVDGDVLTALGTAYLTLGNRTKALATYQKAMSIYVTDWGVYNNSAYELAVVNSKQDLPQALNNATIALGQAQKQGGDDEEGNVAEIRDTIGWIEYRMGKYSQAAYDINQALETIPDEPESHYHLGMIYLAEGERSAAKSEFTKAILIAPAYADAKAALAQVKNAPPIPDVATNDITDPNTPVQ